MDVLDFDSQDEDEETSRDRTPDSLDFDVLGTSNASRRRKKEVTPPTYMIPPTRFSQDFGYQHSSICTPPPTLFAPPSKFSIPQAFLHDPAPFTNDSLRGHDQVHQTRSTLPDFNLSKHSKGRPSSTVSLISPTGSLEHKMTENLEHDLSWLNNGSKSISPIRDTQPDFEADFNFKSQTSIENDSEKKEDSDSKPKVLDVTPFEDSFHFKEDSSDDHIIPSKILPLESTNAESELLLPRISPIATFPIEPEEPLKNDDDVINPPDNFSEPGLSSRWLDFLSKEASNMKSTSRSLSPVQDDRPNFVDKTDPTKQKDPLETQAQPSEIKQKQDLPQTPPIPFHHSHSSQASYTHQQRRFTFSHTPVPEVVAKRRHTFGPTSSAQDFLLHSSTLNISSHFVNKPNPAPPDPEITNRFDLPNIVEEPSLQKIQEIKLNQIFESDTYKETLAHTDHVLQSMEDRFKTFLLPNPSTFTPEQLHEQLSVSRYLIRKLYAERNMYLEKYTKANVGCQRFRHTVQEFERERNFLRQEIQLIKTRFLSGVDDPEKCSQIRGEIMNGLQAENDKLRHEMFSMQESFFSLRHRADCAISMLAELDAGWRLEMETVWTEYMRVQTLRDHFKTQEKEAETDLENQNKIIQKLKEELIVAGTQKKEQEEQILKQREKFDELLSTLKATEEKLQSANEVITMMEKEIYDKDKEMSAVLVANTNLREELEDRLRPSHAYELPQQTMKHQAKEKFGLISTLMTRVEKMLTAVAESCPHPSTVKKVRNVLTRVDRNRNLWTSSFV